MSINRHHAFVAV